MAVGEQFLYSTIAAKVSEDIGKSFENILLDPFFFLAGKNDYMVFMTIMEFEISRKSEFLNF